MACKDDTRLNHTTERAKIKKKIVESLTVSFLGFLRLRAKFGPAVLPGLNLFGTKRERDRQT